jgi:hypothetical protein
MKKNHFEKTASGLIISLIVLFGFFNISLAACPDPVPAGQICYDNPLALNTVQEVLGSMLNSLQGIIVVIAMVFLVVGALLYIFSAGDEGRMKTAKGAIFAAVIGLAIGIAAPSFLKEIYTILGKDPSADTYMAGAPSIARIAANTLNFLLGIVGTAAIIMLVAAGIAYLTAAGNEGQIETAKKMTKWAIVGIAIALGALVLVNQVAQFFTAT